MSLKSDLWKKNISVPRWSLVKRGGEHASFLLSLWSEPGFRNQYNRLQNLNSNLAQMAKDLDKERVSDITVTRSSHWIIQDSNNVSRGILSLVDISDTHKRAELLVGVAKNAPTGTALAAVLICFQLFYHELGYEKLFSFVYPDNEHSLKSTFALGFQKEGTLRKHLIDPLTGERHDVIQTGLLKSEAFSERNKKLANKLLS